MGGGGKGEGEGRLGGFGGGEGGGEGGGGGDNSARSINCTSLSITVQPTRRIWSCVYSSHGEENVKSR